MNEDVILWILYLYNEHACYYSTFKVTTVLLQADNSNNKSNKDNEECCRVNLYKPVYRRNFPMHGFYNKQMRGAGLSV